MSSIALIFVLNLITSQIVCQEAQLKPNNTVECKFNHAMFDLIWIEVTCTRTNPEVKRPSDLNEISPDIKYDMLTINFKNFSRLPESIFIDYEIKQLNLQFNQIEILFERTFACIKYLKFLYLDYNRIKSASLYELKFSNTPYRMLTLSFDVNFVDQLDKILSVEFSSLFELTLKRNGLTHICAHAFENMYGLDSLDLSQNSLTRLEADMFIGLQNLNKLSLEANNIRTIEPGAFRYLASLPTLVLNQNSLTRLEDVLFDETNSIQYIRVNVNRLASLSSSTFDNLRSLFDLTMRGNRMKHLDLNWFLNLTRLKYIRVSMNFIQTVYFPTAGIFDKLTILELSYSNLNAFDFEQVVRLMPNLIELDLSSNQIRLISPPRELSAKSLQFLMLDSNLIENLASNVFEPFGELTYLYLNGNLLRELVNNVFTGLSHLILLDLSSNRITSVRSNTFNGLESLEVLYLTYNRIKRLPVGCFTSLVSLRQLDVSHNTLESIGRDDFIGLISLEELYLSDNYLVSIEAHFARHMPLLVYIYVDGNYISLIQTGTFSHLTLTYLNLEGNLIDTISPNAFYNTSIDYLNLNFNLLSTGNVLFELSTAVQRVDMNRNKLKIFIVDRSAGRFTSQLNGLNLSHNQIEKFRLDNEIFGPVRAVNLSHNLLETLLIDDFKYLTQLNHLDVSNNPLRLIGEMFFLHFNLESIYLNDTFGAGKIELDRLGANVTHLELSYNKLTAAVKSGNFPQLKCLNVRATDFDFGQLINDAWENLVELDLSYDQIDFDLQLLNRFTRLEKLYLAGVNIESIGNVSLNLSYLIELDLSHNRIEVVEGDFFRYLKSLIVLDLSYNEIRSVENFAFDSLIWLQILNLENNFLINFYFPELSELMFVKLNNNRMVNFFSAVKFGSMQNLDFSHNRFENLRFDVLLNIFENDLVELYLNDNRLECLTDQSLATLNSLKTIDLKNNFIVNVDEMAFVNLRNLQWLDLSNNKLTLDSNVNVFGQLSQLVSLNLSLNQIETLNGQLFARLFKLNVLDLSGNRLKTIEPYTFANLGQLVYIDVANNTNLLMREHALIGLDSIKDVWISYDQLANNKRTLVGSFNLTRVRNVNDVDYYRSVYVNYRESPSNVDCWLVLNFIKVNLQLKLKSDADYLEFLRNCFLSIEF